MLAIKTPRFSMSNAPTSRMMKPATIRRAPQGISRVIFHDLYRLDIASVTTACGIRVSMLTMSATHAKRLMQDMLPRKLVERSCSAGSTKHYRALFIWISVRLYQYPRGFSPKLSFMSGMDCSMSWDVRPLPDFPIKSETGVKK